MSGIKRSVQILELLARKSPMGVRAIAQQLQLPLGSVHRALVELEEEAIVDRTSANEWELSYRLLEITGLQLDRVEIPRLARPFAEKIAAATGETVNINALHNMMGVTIDKVRGNERMQLDMRIGSRGPLHCGGAGKAMLAFMNAADQEHVLQGPLPAMTASSITDPQALRAELERIRQRGYSIDNQEVVAGVYCVSMPLLDRDGKPVGAMSITGPSEKHAGPEIRPLVDMLSEATEHVSRRLGFAGQWIIAPQASPVRRAV